MDSHSITLGGRKFKVLSETDSYGQFITNSYINDSAKLRNFLYTHYDPGSAYVIADIGANIGYTARMLNELLPNALIHAFEPSPEVFTLLKDNASFSENIFAVNQAIADKECLIGFNSDSAYGHIISDQDKSSCKINCTTLSNYASLDKVNKFDFVKVDVEGFELDVFKGIRDIADIIYFEFNPWCICHHYKGNPLEVIREIMNEWIIFRFSSNTTLEQVNSADTLAHDTIVHKSLDDFIALRKGVSNQVSIKTRLKRHALKDELIWFLYKGILGRNPDPDGINHYMNKYKSLSDADFIAHLSVDLLNSEEWNSSPH